MFDMYVHLPQHFRAPISRFVEILSAQGVSCRWPRSGRSCGRWSSDWKRRPAIWKCAFRTSSTKPRQSPACKACWLTRRHPYRRAARWRISLHHEGVDSGHQPCAPCSKKSPSAARTTNARTSPSPAHRPARVDRSLIDIAERQGELYGLLKRPDEIRHRGAYDNPKFVEDLVRDVAATLTADARIDAYGGKRNFESIPIILLRSLIEFAPRLSLMVCLPPWADCAGTRGLPWPFTACVCSPARQ